MKGGGLGLEIDRLANHPIYRQIVDAIIEKIEAGRLPPGTRLPTVRDLSHELSVARVTVHKAYGDLQDRGYTDSTVGRGTFVLTPPESGKVDAAELFAVPATPEMFLSSAPWVTRSRRTLSMEIAEPDPAFYPAQEFTRILHSLARDATSLFGYSCPRGEPALRYQIAALLGERGIDAGPEDLLITSGSTQGLSLLIHALTQPGDKVLVEEPAYFGLLALLHTRNIQPVTVPVDDDGPDIEALRRIMVRDRPRFFYTMSRFQNPKGISMSRRRRDEVLELAERFGLLLIEDDIFHPLAYDGEHPPPLKTDDRNDLVVYLDSFSKTLLPGLRVGYLLAPPPLRDRLAMLLQVDTMGNPPLLQHALAEYLRRGQYAEHLRRVIPQYRERRDATLDALQRSLPGGTTWTKPRGGYCCWVTLPAGGMFDDLRRAALQQGVAYTPGEVFLTRPDDRTHLRLCFGGVKPRAIREAIDTIGKLVCERMECRPAPSRSGLAKAAPLV